MTEEFGEFHEELRTVARELLGKTAAETAVDWATIARSGWTGLEVPDEFDGAGVTFAETAVLLEEIGRAAAKTAYPAVAALGIEALTRVESGSRRDELLRTAAAGTAVPVVVLSGEAVPRAELGTAPRAELGTAPRAELGTDPGTTVETAPGTEFAAAAVGTGAAGVTPFVLTESAGGYRLSGAADYVAEAAAATVLLIPASAPGETLVLVSVDPGSVRHTDRPLVDADRAYSRVEAEGVSVPETSIHRFTGDPGAALARLYHRALVATACDSLGVSAAMLDATVEYVRVREQFDRPIGSFQAVKHACADMLVELTVARKLTEEAVAAVVADAPDTARQAAMAKSYTTAAAVRIAGKAMQLHGGIGYTWESSIHRYLKRATLNRSLFGAPAEHRKLLAAGYREQ